MRLVASALCLSSVMLSGCFEDKNAAERPRPLPPTASDLYEFKAPPPPPALPPSPPVAPVVLPPDPPSSLELPLPPAVFPDPAPIDRALRAALLMEHRRQAGAAIDGIVTQAPAEEEDEIAWSLEDEDYRRDNLPEDRSTLPVRRFRVITADRYIGAILENAVNSQIPGRVIAVVERHVFGADGRIPLLPKGTRIVCAYESLAKLGDTRLPVSCSRAIRPDGASIQLTDAAGADQMARTGFIGTVDNRIWERYGTAFIVSVLSAASSLGANQASDPNLQRGGNALSQNLGQVTAKVLEQSVDLAPVIEVPAGSKIQIIPNADIWLRRPEPRSSIAHGERDAGSNSTTGRVTR